MMNTTHAAMAAALASPVVLVAPELAPVVVLAAALGGAFPDVDLVVGEHRKTLHYPVYYTAAALVAGAVAVALPRPTTAAVAAFLCGAALHSLTDVFGGGLGLRPWENDDERGVYLHHARRWVAPRRWVRYDGAPEDLLVYVAFAAPVYAVNRGTVRPLVLAALAVSAVYVLVRKRLADLTPERFQESP
ncbi:MAG: metal-dependent hydrolase [Halobacteriaceae archaeon]